MATPRIWRDDGGLYIRTNGQVYRPGSVDLYGPGRRMDDGDLVEGGKVSAMPVDGTELARLRLADGTITFWHVDGPTRDRGLGPAPGGAVWRPDGRRDFKAKAIIEGEAK